jgi:cytochrome c biogenesis protein CcmG, thiol:disulfide interchange protein DsbE
MRILSALLLCLFFLSASHPVKKLPDVSVKTLEGQTIRLHDIISKHEYTVISFWATWCSPCKKELTALTEYYEDWKTDYGVEIIAITIDDTRGLPRVKPMVASKGWPFVMLSDVNQDIMRALNFQTIPQTYVIDKLGNIVYEHSGYSPGDEFELEAKLKALKR